MIKKIILSCLSIAALSALGMAYATTTAVTCPVSVACYGSDSPGGQDQCGIAQMGVGPDIWGSAYLQFPWGNPTGTFNLSEVDITPNGAVCKYDTDSVVVIVASESIYNLTSSGGGNWQGNTCSSAGDSSNCPLTLTTSSKK